MAAAAALNVVKQIEGLADAPETPQMRDCLGQLVSSLQFFLDHPDSRVRVGSARTLLKLSRGYNDAFRKIDLTKAEAALARCRAVEDGDSSIGGSEEETAELGRLLAETLECVNGERTGESALETAAADAAPRSADAAAPASSSKDGRGQVVLKVAHDLDGKAKANILAKIVAVPGVVAVTLDGPHVIVNTRTVLMAADPAFVEDLLATLSDQGLDGITTANRSARCGEASSSQDPGGEPLGEIDEPGFMDDDDGEPGYLDDEDECPISPTNGAGGGYPQPGGFPPAGAGGAFPQQQWSFFAQSNWMNGRRVLEFDDDPCIAARLAKRVREKEAKRKEEESKIGAVGRWLGWGRK